MEIWRYRYINTNNSGGGEEDESVCQENGQWSVVRLRCGTGAALRAGSNVVYVDGGRGQGQGDNVREVQEITDLSQITSLCTTFSPEMLDLMFLSLSLSVKLIFCPWCH